MSLIETVHVILCARAYLSMPVSQCVPVLRAYRRLLTNIKQEHQYAKYCSHKHTATYAQFFLSVSE